jgi:hypothetical protein
VRVLWRTERQSQGFPWLLRPCLSGHGQLLGYHDPRGCWEWRGAKRENGYGVMRIGIGGRYSMPALRASCTPPRMARCPTPTASCRRVAPKTAATLGPEARRAGTGAGWCPWGPRRVGRAGRDGAPAEGITLYSASDLAWALRRIDSREINNTVKTVQARKVRQLYAMLDGTSCRAAAVRRYFDETAVEACGQCDLCLTVPEATDVTEAAQKALSAVHRLGGRFGRGRIIDQLLGKTAHAPASETQLSTFGIGREFSAAGWRDLMDQLQFGGLLREDPNDGRHRLVG